MQAICGARESRLPGASPNIGARLRANYDARKVLFATGASQFQSTRGAAEVRTCDPMSTGGPESFPSLRQLD